MSYQCGSKTIAREENGVTKTYAVLCGNIKECPVCRNRKAYTTTQRLQKSGIERYYIGKTSHTKANNVARSISHTEYLTGRNVEYEGVIVPETAACWYVRIPQEDDVVFLTNNPRRLKDVAMTEFNFDMTVVLLTELFGNMPAGKRSRIENLSEVHDDTLEDNGVYTLIDRTPGKTDNLILEAGGTMTNMNHAVAIFDTPPGVMDKVLNKVGINAPDFGDDQPLESPDWEIVDNDEDNW